MRAIRKIALSLLLTLEGFVLLVCLYLLISLAGIIIPINSDYDPQNGEIDIYVISNGVHTDICLPVKNDQVDWTEFISEAPYTGLSSEPEFISIGWGDKGFYLDTPEWSDLKASTAINAMLLSSPTAMHITYKCYTPAESEQVKKCSISKSKYEALIHYIKDSFELDQNGNVQLIPNVGYTSVDNFYEAKGSYHLFKTCNVWTNNALSIAGIKTSGLALFEKGILRHL